MRSRTTESSKATMAHFRRMPLAFSARSACMALYGVSLSVASNPAPGSQGKAAAKLIYACKRSAVLSERPGPGALTPVARWSARRTLLAGRESRAETGRNDGRSCS